LSVVDDARGKGRPPRALILTVNGRPTSITEFEYLESGNSWRPIRSRISLLDATGKVKLVSHRDLNGIKVFRDGKQVARADDSPLGLPSVLAGLARLVKPDALYAAPPRSSTEELEGICAVEFLALSTAVVSHAAASAILELAVAGCAFTGGIICPTVLEALVLVAAAEILLTEKYHEWQECRDAHKTETVQPTGGDSSCTDGYYCRYIVWFGDMGEIIEIEATGECWCGENMQ
jgi:hypothetical protein